LAYSPYLTFSAPSNRVFLDRKGKAIHRNPENPDSDALWRIGREAYDLLAIKSEHDFVERYRLFKGAIQSLRTVIEELAAQGRLVDQDGRRRSAEELRLDDREVSEILSMAWEIFDWAVKKGIVVRDENKSEHFLLASLREIDNALVGMALDGRGAVSATVAAANALANAQAISNGSEAFQKVRRQMAYEAATARHRNDPKQADKKFVFECYRNWRANPSRYKSKAQFARDMLEKCAHLESQKKIEDWVRLWDSEHMGDGTLPGE
jgi:hypothetical protein